MPVLDADCLNAVFYFIFHIIVIIEVFLCNVILYSEI